MGFFHKLSRGTNRFFHKVESGSNNVFHKIQNTANQVKQGIDDTTNKIKKGVNEGIDKTNIIARKIGNSLEKAAPVAVALGTATGQPEIAGLGASLMGASASIKGARGNLNNMKFQ